MSAIAATGAADGSLATTGADTTGFGLAALALVAGVALVGPRRFTLRRAQRHAHTNR